MRWRERWRAWRLRRRAWAAASADQQVGYIGVLCSKSLFVDSEPAALANMIAHDAQRRAYRMTWDEAHRQQGTYGSEAWQRIPPPLAAGSQ